MDLPKPTPDAQLSEDRARGRAALLADLRVAVKLAEQMNAAFSRAFPEAAKHVEENVMPKLAGLSVDEKIALGEQQVRDLQEIAFQVSPDAAIDLIEADRPTDFASKNAAAAAIDRAKAKSLPEG